MPETPLRPDLVARAKAVLKLFGSTSVTLLAAIVLGLLLRDYADDIGVPEMVQENLEAQRMINLDAKLRLEALRSSKGIRFNRTLSVWERWNDTIAAWESFPT